MIKEAILKVVSGKNLNREESSLTAATIMRGDATPGQIGALLTALRIKGETVEEITGFAEQMREFSVKIHPQAKDIVDTCGTGGDMSSTFNISTITAIVAAGANVSVAKHGNRSVSSRCGSADFLESFGVKIDMAPGKVAECIDKIGIGFMFAPNFHPAMKHAGPIRREIGFRTIFNVLGPLTNPAGAKHQVIGVYNEKLANVIAEVLKNLGAEHVLVVYGMDGLDEISISDRTKIVELRGGKIQEYYISPEDFGIKQSDLKDLKVQNPEESKLAALSILEQRNHGPQRDIVLLNAAAVIYASGKAKSIQEGLIFAKESIDSGSAFKKINELVEFTQGA